MLKYLIVGSQLMLDYVNYRSYLPHFLTFKSYRVIYFRQLNAFEFAHLWSTAMYLKMVERIYEFSEVFGLRRMRSHFTLSFLTQKMAN